MRRNIAILTMIFIIISFILPVNMPQVLAAVEGSSNLGKILYVSPGQSIQATLATASAGDTIIIKPGTYNECIVICKSNITLQGAEAGKVIIKGVNNRVISIQNQNNVTLEKLFITNGEVPDNGGGLYIDNCQDIVLKDSEIKNNLARKFVKESYLTEEEDTQWEWRYDYYKGGGAYISKSDVSIEGCKILSNIAGYGAGLFICDSAVKINDTELMLNNAWGTEGDVTFTDGYGGAFYVEDSSNLQLTNCKMNTNTADFGGAIYSESSCVEIKDCASVSNNVGKKMGGAIYNSSGILNLRNSFFTGNVSNPFINKQLCSAEEDEAGFGGAVFSQRADVSVIGCGFHENSGHSGGAIYSVNNTLTLNFNKFQSNRAYEAEKNNWSSIITILESFLQFDVVAIISNAVGTITSMCVVKAIKPDNAVFPWDGWGHFGGEGAAVYCYNTALSVEGGEFIDNRADQEGAAIYCVTQENNNSKAKINQVGFAENSAQKGGSIFIVQKDYEINNCSFLRNKADAVGGGIFTLAKGKILNSTFTNNCGPMGGGICINGIMDGDVLVNNCSFNENYAQFGGAIDASGIGQNKGLKIKNSTINKNVADFGGGISIREGSGSLDGCTITNNIAKYVGVIRNYNNSNLEISNSLIKGNKKQAIYNEKSSSTLISNCTIIQNGFNPLVASEYSTINIYNNIILGNTEKHEVSSLDIMTINHSRFDAKYNVCDLEGLGNMTASWDIFRDPSKGDFRIRNDYVDDHLGPMDAGSNEYVIGNKDLAGNMRIIDNSGDGRAVVDMGAYEQDMLKVTFAAAHPQAAIAHGRIDGETEQIVHFGDAVDASLVTITPCPAWEFNGWETLDHTKITDLSHITGNLNLYARYNKKYVGVAFQFNPHKLKLTDSFISTINVNLFNSLIPLDENTMQYITNVQQYRSPKIPQMVGINGWRFADWNPWPELVVEDTIIVAEARPTVTYNLGNKGSYGKDKEKVVVSDFTNPLFVPEDGKICVKKGYMIMGWSDKKGGEVITLPERITEPATYYAIYGDLQPSIVFDKVIKANEYQNIDTFKDTADEGVPFTITGYIVDESGDNWIANIDFGDPIGPYELKINPNKAFSIQHKFYDDQPVQQIKVNVCNNYGYAATATAQVQVNNVAPLVDAGDDELFLRGLLFKRQVVFKDPGYDTWTAEIDYGNGVTRLLDLKEKNFELSQLYNKSGIYPISIIVRDHDGGEGNDTFQLKIKDYLLLLNVGEDAEIEEGEAFKRDIIVSGPVEKIAKAEVDYGDGSNVQELDIDSKLLLKHSFSDDGSYKVSLRIIDVDGDEYKESFNVNVKNAVPVVDAGRGRTIYVNRTFKASGSFNDPGQDSWTAEVNYGDGSGWQFLSLNDKEFTLKHSYHFRGDYKVIVRITDDDGGVGEGSFRMNVRSRGLSDRSGFNALLTQEGGIRLSIANAKDKNGNLLNGNYDISAVCAELGVNYSNEQVFVGGAMSTIICVLPEDEGLYTFTISVEGITNSKDVNINSSY